MKNYLLNKGTHGTYVLIQDNEMKPHPKFFLGMLPFVFTKARLSTAIGR